MKVIQARNVNDAFILGIQAVKQEGVLRDSRNGPVRVFPGPVATVYEKPNERVIFAPERDANPYFHFMESLWMLAGRNDVDWISQFSSNIANFSDDGVTFHGAYGHRWRKHFQVQTNFGVGVLDQFETIVKLLRENQDDRRVVLQMWDAASDLGMQGKDFPCNLIATFRINPYGFLDMTVFNRSNDMIWGAYGANAVHFSVLQEVMAGFLNVPIGQYWQVSTNFHAYIATLEKHGHFVDGLAPGFDDYSVGMIKTFPIVNTPMNVWLQDLEMFMEQGPVLGLRDPFFRKVATPMYQSWYAWKDRENPGHKEAAMDYAMRIQADDWRKACTEWLQRRM